MPLSKFRFSKLLALFSTLLILLPTQAAENVPDIESLMTEDELRATGVEQLNAGQIEALNAWLLRYRNGEIGTAVDEVPVSTSNDSSSNTAPAATPVPDVYPPPRERVEIFSRIAGEFEGWEGRTRFSLENGQVWEQRRRGRWKTSLTSPEVRLYQNFIGAWEMEVVEEDRRIGVRRIR